jgi:hypothetical protein
MSAFESPPLSPENRLSRQEVEKILARFNDPRLSATDSEYFIIDFGEKKTFIPKHKTIPVINGTGQITKEKVEDRIALALQQ